MPTRVKTHLQYSQCALVDVLLIELASNLSPLGDLTSPHGRTRHFQI